MSKCGCGGDPPSKQYMMVEATPSDNSKCEPNMLGQAYASCPKQEPLYDFAKSGFLVPTTGSTVSFQVCNPTVYYVGQWLRFDQPSAIFRIQSITNNVITLLNECPNGIEISENPLPGTTIPENTMFFVDGPPDCRSEEEINDSISAALAQSTQLCVPALEESGDQTEIQVVGRINNDPGDVGFRKCIKRIKSFFFRGSTPFLPGLSALPEGDSLLNRVMVVNKSTGEVKARLNYSEYSNILNNANYALLISNSLETPVGPAMFPSLFNKLIEENSTAVQTAWPILVSGQFEKNFTLNYSEINNIKRPAADFYAIVRLNVIVTPNAAGDDSVIVRLNNQQVMRLEAGYNNNDHKYNGHGIVSVPILIDNTTKNLKLNIDKATSNNNFKYYYRLELDGIYI